MKDQGSFEKLKLARKRRDVFIEKVTVRVDYDMHKQLLELSDNTGRTVADLFRSALTLILTAARRVSPWNREESVKNARADDTSPPCPESDNIPYV